MGLLSQFSGPASSGLLSWFVFGCEHSARLRPLWFKPGNLWESPDLAMRAYLLPEVLTSVPACCVPGLHGIPHSLALKVNIFQAKPGTFLSHILNLKGLAHGLFLSQCSEIFAMRYEYLWFIFSFWVLISRICFCSNIVLGGLLPHRKVCACSDQCLDCVYSSLKYLLLML